MATTPFTNGRDAESQLAFAININEGVGRFSNTFGAGDIVEVPLTTGDRYALFFPTPGANFIIASSSTIPVIPTAGTGNPMFEYDGVQNPALIDLVQSGFDELWVKSDVIQTMTVLIYRGNN